MIVFKYRNETIMANILVYWHLFGYFIIGILENVMQNIDGCCAFDRIIAGHNYKFQFHIFFLCIVKIIGIADAVYF